jgi:hypothetical protein
LEVANGDKLAALGEAVLSVELGDWKTNHRFIVANVSSGVILGEDFLRQNQIDILLSECRLKWTNDSTPVDIATNSAHKAFCYRVALSDDVHLSSEHKEIIVRATLPLNLEDQRWD